MNLSLIRKTTTSSKIHSLQNVKITQFLNIKSIVARIKNAPTHKENYIHNISFIINRNGCIKCSKNIGYDFSIKALEKREFIEKEILYYFKKSITVNNIDELVLFSMIELYASICLINDFHITTTEFYSLLKDIEYVDIVDKNRVKFLIEQETQEVKRKDFYKNNNFLVSNKYSYELPKEINRLKDKKLRSAIKRLDLCLLEIPKERDVENLTKFLNELAKTKEKLKLKRFDFQLRIKKTKKINKDGIFIVSGNTIIIDPRHPEAVIHELGHYIYENKLSFTHNGKRYYYSSFQGLIRKFISGNKTKVARHELEKYSDESEYFSYWFENLLK